MFTTLSLVALGGAIGASLRWLMGVAILRATGPADFPVAILSANVLGSFLMGVFVVVAAHKGLTHLSPFVMTGLLGGFTTFSAFSLDALVFLERGAIGLALVYMLASVIMSIGACLVGYLCLRTILS